MGRKKIQKAPKQDKAGQDHESGSEHQDLQAGNKKQEKKSTAKDNQKPQPKKRGQKAKSQGKQKQGKQSNDSKNIELFSDDFSKKIDSFKEFYHEYLQAIASVNSNVNIASELSKTTEGVKNKIEEACLQVLRKDMSAAINWIQQRQQSLQEQISAVEKAQEETRKALDRSGNFTSAEIDSQLVGIKNKKTGLEKKIEQLQATKQRAKEIYKRNSSSMDEQ